MMSAEDAATKMVARSTSTYTTKKERAALRCALGDAAALCDAIGRDIAVEHQFKRGCGTTQKGQELMAIATRCGDAITAMRRQITADG